VGYMEISLAADWCFSNTSMWSFQFLLESQICLHSATGQLLTNLPCHFADSPSTKLPLLCSFPSPLQRRFDPGCVCRTGTFSTCLFMHNIRADKAKPMFFRPSQPHTVGMTCYSTPRKPSGTSTPLESLNMYTIRRLTCSSASHLLCSRSYPSQRPIIPACYWWLSKQQSVNRFHFLCLF
jgi:hypothetical protein